MTANGPSIFVIGVHWDRGAISELNEGVRVWLCEYFSLSVHSRPQRPRSFWSAPNITTSGQVQQHSGFEWLCKPNRLRPEPIRFVRLDSEHAESNGKSVNRGLPELDLARGREFWCWPKGAWPLRTRMTFCSVSSPFSNLFPVWLSPLAQLAFACSERQCFVSRIRIDLLFYYNAELSS